MEQAELTFVDELITAEPGQTVRTTIKLRNTSDRVLHFALRPAPTSPAASWMTIAPDSIRLLELDDGQADVFIQVPPGAASAAGRVPIAVVADPGDDSPLLPSVAEADVAVGAVHAVDAALVPRQLKGRLRGKLRVTFTNRGNEEVRLSVSGSDESDNENLHFGMADGRIAVPPGGSADAFMRIRPDKPIIIGKPAEHPFVVTYRRRASRIAQMESQDAAEVSADLPGSFSQKPIIAKWMIVLAALLLIVAALVIVYNRATAADPPDQAPAPPALSSASAADEVLRLVFSVPENPQAIEVQRIEPLEGDDYDLATPIDEAPVRSESEGTTRAVEIPLDASEAEAMVYYRFRAIDARGRGSIWQGGSVPQGTSIEYAAPVITSIMNVAYLETGATELTWGPPPDSDRTNLRYRLFRADPFIELNVDADFEFIGVGQSSARIFAPNVSVIVQAVNADDPTLVSRLSEPRRPDNDVPNDGIPALQAPMIANVTWNEPESESDPDSAFVEWTWEPPAGFDPVDFDFEIRPAAGGDRLVPIVPRAGNRALVPMPLGGFPVTVQAVWADGRSDPSPRSDALGPQGPPPTVPTTTVPTTTVPTTTTAPPTTIALESPDGFWILPQGFNLATSSDLIAWETFLDRQVQSFPKSESDLSPFEPDDIPDDRDIWVIDSYPNRDSAKTACGILLNEILNVLGKTPSPCWVVGDGLAERLDLPPETTP